MTNDELNKLRQQVEDTLIAIDEEEKRRAQAAKNGGVSLDTSEVELRLDALIIHGENQVQLLQRLNQVSDQIYNKLEELSLKLLEVIAVGMPLLQDARNKGE